MQATADALDLSPPDGGRWRGPFGLAFGVHLLLVLALTWGVSWETDTVTVAEAELWSRLPQVAAPPAVEPPSAEPEPTLAPQPAEAVAEPPPAAAPPDQAARDAEIALSRQREAQARQLALQREAEAQQREQQRRDQLAKEKATAEKATKDQAAKAKADKAKADKRKAEQAAKEKAAKDKAAKAAAAKQEAQLEADRKKNLARMMGQLGASGAPGSTGQAKQSSGPSASYAGKLVARIRPNIVFADSVAGNPRAEVEVRALPDGTIVGSRLLKSSGHRAWDDAVLRAVERTGKLPQDENGRVPSTLILGFRPQD